MAVSVRRKNVTVHKRPDSCVLNAPVDMVPDPLRRAQMRSHGIGRFIAAVCGGQCRHQYVIKERFSVYFYAPHRPPGGIESEQHVILVIVGMLHTIQKIDRSDITQLDSPVPVDNRLGQSDPQIGPWPHFQPLRAEILLYIQSSGSPVGIGVQCIRCYK